MRYEIVEMQGRSDTPLRRSLHEGSRIECNVFVRALGHETFWRTRNYIFDETYIQEQSGDVKTVFQCTRAVP